MSKIVPLVIASHLPLELDGVESFLRRQPSCFVVLTTSSTPKILLAVGNLRPQAVILDFHLPPAGCVKAIESIWRRCPRTGIVVLLEKSQADTAARALRAGPGGYVFKSADRACLLDAVHAVASGQQYWCDQQPAKQAGEWQKPPRASVTNILLSEREKDITRLICQERTTEEISRHTGLTRGTIETYRNNILLKARVRNTAGLVVFAIRTGIYQP